MRPRQLHLATMRLRKGPSRERTPARRLRKRPPSRKSQRLTPSLRRRPRNRRAAPEEQAAPAEDDGEGKEAEAPAESKEADAESAAAVEKVKAGDVPVPTDPVALAAFQALEANCARCHQAGASLKRKKPAKDFGNILHLEEIAQVPGLILPGNPDGSKLFIQIAKQEMPYDCFQEFNCDREPTEKEVQAIYDWIKSLGQVVVAACTGRNPIDEEAIVTAIAADLDAQQEHLRKGMRYITLTNFYNACAPETDMVRYRQGVVKLLNSLSREADPLKMRTIDPEKTIIAFNLDELGWTAADWDKIIGAYPYAMKPDATVYDTVVSLTGTPLAWVRGDWFAFTASRPPLYYDLLKLPQTFAELEKQVDVDVKSNIEKFLAKRAGFQHSGVSKHNRLIERHTIPTGYFWTSYDFKGDRPEQSLFVHPLGPDGADAFKHDGGETIFSLPNGFQAYYLNTAPGARLDKGPTEIVLDDSQLDRAVTNGISCMGCHNQGIRQGTDEIRKHVLADRTFSKDVRTDVEALYPTNEEFKKLLDEDAGRFRNAMLRAGLDPELDSQKVGVESINFLSKAYEKAIDLRIAAAEYGLLAEAFAQGLLDAGGESAQLKRRLEQGVLPREILEANFKEIIVQVSDNEPIEIAAARRCRCRQGRRQVEGGDPRLRSRAHLRSQRLQGQRPAGVQHQVEGGLPPHADQCRCERRGHGDLPQQVPAGQFPRRRERSAIPRCRGAVPVPPQGPWDRDGDRHLQCLGQDRRRHQARLQDAAVHRSRQLSRLPDAADCRRGEGEGRRGQEGRGRGEEEG